MACPGGHGHLQSSMAKQQEEVRPSWNDLSRGSTVVTADTVQVAGRGVYVHDTSCYLCSRYTAVDLMSYSDRLVRMSRERGSWDHTHLEKPSVDPLQHPPFLPYRASLGDSAIGSSWPHSLD